MSIDLKPINTEVIHKMGLNPHELWVIKVNDVVYGPFEVESLKDYATENEKEFHEAQASRVDTNDWHPFFSHAHFQDISHSESKNTNTLYWILLKGQKVGPLSKMDVNKKLEMEILTLSDFVSLDEGVNWKKFYQLEEFNAASSNTVNNLPQAPNEASFQRSKSELLERYEMKSPVNETKNGLAALAYMGMSKDKITLNLDEIDLQSLNETQVSRSLKWAVPSAVAGVGILAFLGHVLLKPYSSSEVITQEENNKAQPQTKVVSAGSGPYGSRLSNPRINQRRPASNPPNDSSSRSGLMAQPHTQNEYPTQVETHQNEPDPMIDPVSEADNNPPQEAQEHQEPQENSLVSTNSPAESLDQVMGEASNPSSDPPEAPVIEEVSDF